MKLFLPLFAFVLLSVNSNAQNWLKDIQNPHANFYVVQKEFNEWKKNQVNTASQNQYEDISEQYYRWENYWKYRIKPDGTLQNSNQSISERKKFLLQNNISTRSGNSGNWQPYNYNTVDNEGYVGRVDCIAISPVDSNTIWAGSPSGGLWKTTDDGVSWTTNTDTLPKLGISDIVIDPKNPAIMYLSMGDRDAAWSDGIYSIGVLKSIDTGTTWQTTGLNWQSSTVQPIIRRLIIDPTNDNILYAATNKSGGFVVYKTINAGVSWDSILSVTGVNSFWGAYIDIALMPGNSSTLYVAYIDTNENVHLNSSVNGGTNFSADTLLKTTTAQNIRLAVTPANPDYLYVLVANSADFNSIYLSKDGGNTFTLQANSPNILSYTCSNNPTATDGQGDYDLSIAASPVNADSVFVGGISIFQSHDAGVTWTLNDCWTSGNTHPDHHYTLFSPYNANVIYEGCDGGIFKSSNFGSTWTSITSNMRTTQYYSGDPSQLTLNKFVGGAQDNGTLLVNNNAISIVGRGDGGFSTFFDNDSAEVYYYTDDGEPEASVNGAVKNPTLTNFITNPQNSNSLFQFDTVVYKSYDYGTTWFAVTPDINPGKGEVSGLKFPYEDSSIFFVQINAAIYKVNVESATLTLILANANDHYSQGYCVSNTDSNKIWVAEYVSDSTKYEVYYTSNGGTSWTDVTGSLPNVPMSNLVYQGNSNDATYLATDAGVFYRDATLNDWVYYSNGLPNVILNQLKIDYLLGQLTVSTYGRGIWETPLYSGTTGINQLSITSNQLTVYPNPNNGNFKVQLQNLKQNTIIEIFNVLGENIYSAKLNSATTQLNLSNQPAGIYLYRVITQDGQFISSGKMVIE